MKTPRIIFIKGSVETLEFFSIQIAESFKKHGLETWFWDMRSPFDSREAFDAFQDYKDTILLTFNFIGLSGESQFQSQEHTSLWEYYHIKICCIMVDHPMYYYRQLSSLHKNLTLICIDRDHQAFTEHFYPSYGKVHFLPLAGTLLSEELFPYSQRETDVIFTGNYMALENLMLHIRHMDKEYKAFYFDIIKELTAHPDLPMEQALIQHLNKEFPQITREETLSCMYNMIFIDLYVRSWFRREIICSLAEHGIPVRIIGKDWELAGCKRPENLILTGQQDSLACLTQMAHAKISVNMMPWFKKGAHDRIFNAMLQGCVVVTDSSDYLEEILCNGQDSVQFSLKQYEKISQQVTWLLEHPDKAEMIAAEGFRKASACHTWENRACTLLDIFACL